MNSRSCIYYAGGVCSLWTRRNGAFLIYCGNDLKPCNELKTYNTMIADKERKKGSGGARAGSGRKRQGEEVRQQFSATIDAQTAETIRRTAERLGTSNGGAIDEIVKFFAQNANK